MAFFNSAVTVLQTLVTLPPLLLQTPEKGGQGQWQITASITTSS